ncbi:hypothetical protein BKI52_12220 [marine bacterium AO1-C]|nr:hypothetical protein BKI52_12220 [marine bacterium AO1-C]
MVMFSLCPALFVFRPSNHTDMKIIYQACAFLMLLFIFQSCAFPEPNHQDSFFALCASDVVNLQIKKGNLKIDKSVPIQTIDKTYDDLVIVYKVDTQKNCVLSIKAVFKNLNSKEKILNWAQKSKVTINSGVLFDGQRPFSILGQFGGLFQCKPMSNGFLKVEATYSNCK